MKFKLSAINCTVAISLALAVCAEAQNYFVFVSNERSGDVSVIDGATDALVATTFKVSGHAEFTPNRTASAFL